jgi:hypothetical protein
VNRVSFRHFGAELSRVQPDIELDVHHGHCDRFADRPLGCELDLEGQEAIALGPDRDGRTAFSKAVAKGRAAVDMRLAQVLDILIPPFASREDAVAQRLESIHFHGVECFGLVLELNDHGRLLRGYEHQPLSFHIVDDRDRRCFGVVAKLHCVAPETGLHVHAVHADGRLVRAAGDHPEHGGLSGQDRSYNVGEGGRRSAHPMECEYGSDDDRGCGSQFRNWTIHRESPDKRGSRFRYAARGLRFLLLHGQQHIPAC